MDVTSLPTLQQTQGKAPYQAAALPVPSAEQVAKAEETQEAFADFFGKTFYGQLLKSMRQTVGKPAYFHGGRAEEVFRSQLDQTIADHMAESQGAELSQGAFRQQFPDLAQVLKLAEAEAGEADSSVVFDQLQALPRR